MRFFHFPSLRRGVWRRSFFLLLGVSTLTLSASFAQEVREWRDAAGRPIMTSTNKKLVGTLDPEYDDPAKVRINMGDKTFRFTLANLSEADQKYVAGERAKKTASNKPATESKPTANKPATESKPTAAPKPTANKPTATSKPTSTKPATESKPTANKPATASKPTANKPATESKPTANKPTTTSKPTATAAKPTANKPATESKPTANKPTTTSKPTANKPATESKPTAPKPATESKPTAPKPATESKPTATKPATESKPTATKPATAAKPTAAASTRTTVSNPAPAQAEDASRALASIPKDGVKRALLVGVDDYAEFADLKYAVADVEAIRERLIGLGFKPENIVELKSTSPANLRPSQRYIRRQVDALFKAAGPNDLLFLHFSGHGFQTDGVVRFAPEDATATGDENVLDPETTISLTEIVERLTSSQAKFKWLIVDACRENPTGTRSAAANARALKNIDPRKGVLVLQSCAEGELSFEDAEAGRGLFTGRLLEAFDGKADFDGDGALSALDVCKYVSEQTLAASKTRFNATQTPYFSGEFADFIVAEDLKRHGLTREDWSQAEALYNEAIEQVREKDFEAALQKIEAALEIVAEVPETEDAKKRYLERKTMIDYLVDGEQKVVKLDAPSEETNDEFGKPNKFVSTVEQLTYAVENAQDGDIIQLAKGDYVLSDRLVVPAGIKLSLVGATGKKEEVRVLQPYEKSHQTKFTVITLSEGSRIELADLTLESKNSNALSANNGQENDAQSEASAIRCVMISAKSALSLTNGRVALKNCEFKGKERCQLSPNTTAEDCDFTGGINIFLDEDKAGTLTEKSTAIVKNCKIHDSKDAALRIWGDHKGSQVACEIIDCEIYNTDGCGIALFNGTQATIRGGIVRACSYKYFYAACGLQINAYEGAATRVTVSDTTFEDCEMALSVDERSVCDATNLQITRCRLGGRLNGDFTGKSITFTDVKKEWEIETANATLDDQTLTKNSVWQRMFQQMPARAPKRVETVAELEEAFDNLKDGETIEIAKGTYEISDSLYISNYLEVAIVGETGNMEDARIINKNGGNVFSTHRAALTLTGVTLETTDNSCVSAGSSYLTLTRCRVQNSSDSNNTIYNGGHGKTVIKECEIHNLSSKGEALLAYTSESNETPTLEAEDSDFNGTISINDLESSLIVNCAVRGNGNSKGVDVRGDEEQGKTTRCDILGCNISHCNEGVHACDYAQVSIRNTKISNCSTGVEISGAQADCQATGVTFTNVEDEWYLFDGGTATHNGRRVTSSY